MGEPNYITAGELVARELATLVPSVRPSNPQEGWLYVDRNDHHIYFYNGKVWKALDVGGKPVQNPGAEDWT